ncbi:ATP-binding cassette domain-containing protein [Erysipelothrix rhusiopathiae]|uniref:ABC transporter ATP-binding protein n=1 Tax=Erysipelothrix rhusiopathiae TaxID=1648 RepID=UPI001EDE3E07|nr:ATP-binding cassette domain-containing protein [Erysipelothrix rhusiopathiae]MCG4436406.1 ATP-binding cassette domain-containing protein [Erysipelothrix rhusiopathiae]MDE8141914.1 ATP-binding cassette domain-containing protein [Erysipelothrix rhusiopathiae]MDE8163277.1 ATP-binding cassette domain-containing protein [Erysipelothrix rhusiopathiae]MDE8165531.1 ATP-binding cassette domain-containing protein [Erysipelothrix rhusiopathiae]MDE8208232.1 ATP-binding cassette domain-containing protei
MIKIRNVSKRFKNLEIFEDISLELPKGKIVGLVGENGSGKSVLMKMLCGYSKPTSGSINVYGETLGVNRDFPNSVGVLINDSHFIKNYTGMENLEHLINIRKQTDKTFLNELIQIFDMERNIHKRYKSYSLGMKQKLRIIQAFMEQPNLVLLDEPFTALDKRSTMVLVDLIKRYINEDRIIIFTSHEYQHIEHLADTVLTIQDKNIMVDCA